MKKPIRIGKIPVTAYIDLVGLSLKLEELFADTLRKYINIGQE